MKSKDTQGVDCLMVGIRAMIRTGGIGVLFILTFVNGHVLAESFLRCPGVFAENMVLQRQMPVPIWGWASPGEDVTVTFSDQSKMTKTLSSGRWQVSLDSMEASSESRILTVKAGDRTLTYNNVLVGEVWLASGQSNMNIPLSKTTMPNDVLASLNKPMIRVFRVGEQTSSLPVADPSGIWKILDPESAPNESAVASYFAMKLQDELKIPIGILLSSWSATHIEPWIPAVGFDQVPELQHLAAKARSMIPETEVANTHLAAVKAWVIEAEHAQKSGETPRALPLLPRFSSGLKGPGAIYNAMIYPVVGYAMRRAIWYQGESSIGDLGAYENKLRALIAGWRAVWKQGEFPFYFVQLPPYRYNISIGAFWEGQLNVCRSVKNTGMDVTTDVGDLADLHPKNKEAVGHRLALWALAKDYGKKLAYSGPLYKGFEIKGDSIVVSFDHAESGLVFKGNEPSDIYIQGEGDANFVKANVSIDGSKLVITHPEKKKPLHVRMGWSKDLEPNLVNTEGLPASPFRTDRYAVAVVKKQ